MRRNIAHFCTLTSVFLTCRQTSPHDVELSTENDVDRLGVSEVFLFQNARGKGMLIVSIEHRHRLSAQ